MNMMNNFSIIVRYGHIFAERSMKEFDLGFPEQVVMMYLANGKQMNQDSIAKHYRLDKGAIAKTVLKLENKQLIIRKQNPDNKRENLLSLSPEGNKILGIMHHRLLDWNLKLYEGISEEDKKELERITNIMTKNALDSVK